MCFISFRWKCEQRIKWMQLFAFQKQQFALLFICSNSIFMFMFEFVFTRCLTATNAYIHIYNSLQWNRSRKRPCSGVYTNAHRHRHYWLSSNILKSKRKWWRVNYQKKTERELPRTQYCILIRFGCVYIVTEIRIYLYLRFIVGIASSQTIKIFVFIIIASRSPQTISLFFLSFSSLDTSSVRITNNQKKMNETINYRLFVCLLPEL